MNPYSGTSTLAKVLRAAALGGGLVYGSVKLGYLKVRRFVPSNEGDQRDGGQHVAVARPHRRRRRRRSDGSFGSLTACGRSSCVF